MSGLEQIQTSPEGLDVVLASSPSHRTVLEGSWTRTFTVLSFLPQCPLLQKARSRAGVGSALALSDTWVRGAFPTLQDPCPALGARAGPWGGTAACTPRCLFSFQTSCKRSPPQIDKSIRGARHPPAPGHTKRPLFAASSARSAVRACSSGLLQRQGTGCAPGTRERRSPARGLPSGSLGTEAEQVLPWERGGEFPRPPSRAQSPESPVARGAAVPAQGRAARGRAGGSLQTLRGVWGSARHCLRGCRAPGCHMDCPVSGQTGAKFRGSHSPSPPWQLFLSPGNGGTVLPSFEWVSHPVLH